MKSVLPGETCKGMRESKQGKGRTGKGYGFKIESGLCILSWGTLDCKLHPRKRPPFGDPLGFPGGSDGKESACDAGDLSLIPESGRFPGEESGNPLQYSCLENPMDRGGAWWATVHRISKSWHNWATSLLLAFYATAADSPDTLCSRKLVQKVFRELDTFRNWSHDANPCFSSYLGKQ